MQLLRQLHHWLCHLGTEKRPLTSVKELRGLQADGSHCLSCESAVCDVESWSGSPSQPCVTFTDFDCCFYCCDNLGDLAENRIKLRCLFFNLYFFYSSVHYPTQFVQCDERLFSGWAHSVNCCRMPLHNWNHVSYLLHICVKIMNGQVCPLYCNNSTFGSL